MIKNLGITTTRPSAGPMGPTVPPNAEEFIFKGSQPPPPEPATLPAAATIEVVGDRGEEPEVCQTSVTKPAASKAAAVPKAAAVRRERSTRIGPEGGTKTVLANGNQRVTISLELDLYNALRVRAFKEHVDNTEIVRQALRKFLNL